MKANKVPMAVVDLPNTFRETNAKKFILFTVFPIEVMTGDGL